MAVATTAAGETAPGAVGLDGVLAALRGLHPGGPGAPGGRAPSCCPWVCAEVVDDVRRRRVRAGGGAGAPRGPAGLWPVMRGDVGLPGPDQPDLEFEAVLARRLAHRYLKVVADARAVRPVPRVWRLLLEPPAVPPGRLALAEVGALLDYDLTLAVVGACTVLGRTPGNREREAHGRIAAVLTRCLRELARRGEETAEAVARVGGAVRCDAAWRRARHLWTLRGWPAEGEAERDALDRAVRGATARLLAGAPDV